MKLYSTIKTIVVRTMITAAFAASPVVALASGSDAAGGNQTSDAQAYNLGKGVYAQKLACSGCPLAGKSVTAEIAGDLLNGKGTQSLSADETQVLAVYLKRRFKL